MTNRCDSVDALMYAYYEFMRIKEENQMLEKNKDYIEMRVSSTDCAFTQNEPTSICVDGYVYTTYMNLPDPGELYVLISKEKFDKLQESVADYMALSFGAQYRKDKCEQLQFDLVHYKELARQWESNYRLLLAKTGFTNIEDIIDYIHDPSMTSPEDKTLREIIDECETDYISERDRAEKLQKENEALEKGIRVYSRALTEWKEGTGCPSPSAAKTLIESGASWHHAYNEIKAANEKLEDDVNSWKNVTEYSTPESFLAAKINDLGNDCLSWKMVTGCSCPKDLSKKIVEWEKTFTPRISARDLCSAMSNAIESYKHKFEPWQKATGCNIPEEAEATIRNLRGRIDEMKEFAAIASNWTDRIVED